MFKNVIVKTPCSKVCDGITGTPGLGTPNFEKALEQHAAYIEALKQCGVQVTVLPANENFPDSCFVEDTAVLTKKVAIITNPGAETRAQEIVDMIPVIEGFYGKDKMEFITAPGTLEGGDVMMVGDTFYVGESARTNKEGIAQFKAILEKYGYVCKVVSLTEVLHLKTGINYLENNNMLVSGEFINNPEFAEYNQTIIPTEEAYAANCINVNGTVIVPKDFPQVLALVEGLGYKTLTVDTSEFRKIDGGLSCLSLRF